MIGGFYTAGDSVVHRMGAGGKLLALLLFGTVILAVPSPILAGAALLLALAAYPLAGLSLPRALSELRPLALPLALLFLAQLWLASLADALLLALRFSALLLGAGLVTRTTRTDALIAVVTRALAPLSRFGVNPEKTALAFSLAIRFLPAIANVVAEVREAQAARGRSRSLVTLALPVLVRLLKMADEIAEAIDARS